MKITYCSPYWQTTELIILVIELSCRRVNNHVWTIVFWYIISDNILHRLFLIIQGFNICWTAIYAISIFLDAALTCCVLKSTPRNILPPTGQSGNSPECRRRESLNACLSGAKFKTVIIMTMWTNTNIRWVNIIIDNICIEKTLTTSSVGKLYFTDNLVVDRILNWH